MVSAEFNISPKGAQGGVVLRFAEPDWQGDRDYQTTAAETDLDAAILRLDSEIRSGLNGGWLNAYYARRAAFDLQSIRGQIARERRIAAQPLAEDTLRAILSRVDRLSDCLTEVRLGATNTE